MHSRQVAEAISEVLAKEIVALRTEKGLSKNQTATRAGLAVSFVSDLESGKRRASVETLVKLAWVFGTSASAILAKCEAVVKFKPSEET
jgi:transcriptional regulator with XRE-family HTH domain